MTASEYYADAAVRARILEFAGAAPGREPTAAYFAVLDSGRGAFPTWDDAARFQPWDLPWDAGCDISSALWHRDRLTFFIEIDYLNVDQPDEPFRHPADVWVSLEPTYRAIQRTLASVELPAIVFASGRGYHFLGMVPLDDPVVEALAALLPATPAWWRSVDARRPAGVTTPLTERQARAADGLGLLVEYVGHLSLREARRASPLPVVFNGTTVGGGLNGRAAVSIDFSHVGDPLDVRHVRAGFSTYQWHRQRPDIFGEDIARLVPAMAVVPRTSEGLMGLLTGGRSLDAAQATARTATTRLPDVSGGVRRLLERYQRSALARFHARYLPAVGAATHPAVPRSLPGCAARALEQPNDLLLMPGFLQHLVRVLLSRDWDAAGIAALVRERYDEDHRWGARWSHMHAATRAAFDVRVFAGMVESGLDTLEDFNCVSTQEKNLCPREDCVLNLEHDRDRLRARWGS